MGILGRFFGRGSTKLPNARVLGHRGVAAGSIAARQAAGKASRATSKGDKISLEPGILVEAEAFTEAERRQHHFVGTNDVQAFVYDAEPMTFHSTNVLMAQYFARDNKLMVEFHSGKKSAERSYMYSSMTPQEAIAFAQAGSKGRWVHRNLVGKKPFVRGATMAQRAETSQASQFRQQGQDFWAKFDQQMPSSDTPSLE